MTFTHPKIKLPTKAPRQIPDAIQEASLAPIGPDSKGVSSDFNIGMLELDQPQEAPKEKASKFNVTVAIH